MRAVFRHEVKSYFHSITPYFFGAFLLVITGIGAMIYNIRESVSNFEYVLSFGSIILVLIVPLLTMRVIAEEKKQKTDQLLYSLPLTTTKVVIGKYLALMMVFLVPMIVICFYPLIFSLFGEVYLLTSYGSLLAFFLMGAALVSIGVFISSLTENQGIAAGVSVAVMLFSYYSVTISEYVSATPLGSMIALCVIAVLVAVLVRFVTRSTNLAYGVGLVLIAAILVVYLINSSLFDGLLPKIMTEISLFSRFYTFVNGVFDVTAIIYYLTVIVFFLFLTVQSLEKRRYN